MNIFEADQTLLIRALNATRQVYLPSYIGVRILATQIAKDTHKFLQRAIYRRLKAEDEWRYQPFKMYKGSEKGVEGITHEYRDCLAPSPFTALAEAFVLGILSINPAFQNPTRTYSYRWPKTLKSGFSYEFYAEGYKQRNTDIEKALRKKDHVAVVTDIRGFYPSANFDMVKTAIDHRFIGSPKELEEWHSPILTFYSQLFHKGQGGIPIGPSASHLLGHLVLDNVDEQLTSKYGFNYFRYVDDIVVVCHRSLITTAQSDISSSVSQSGFTLNEGKTTILEGPDWSRNVTSDDIEGNDNFRSLIRDLTVYLAFHPERAEELNQMLRESGLSIPIKRLKASSSYSRFRYFLSRRKDKEGLSHALSILLLKNKDFLDRAIRLKESYEIALEVQMGELEYAGNTRRWRLQKIRRIVNTLFYLRSFDEWYQGANIFNNLPELIEQKALATSIRAGILNPVLPFYGRSPSALAELWFEHGRGPLKFAPLAQVDNVTLDGLATMRLHGLLPEDSVSELYNLDGARLLSTISDMPSQSRSIPDLSFPDEIESLRLGIGCKTISELSHSKYSTSEGPILSALTLLGSEYTS